jgi:Cu+-exporting ATPase
LLDRGIVWFARSQAHAKGKTSDALYKLLDLQAKTALLCEVAADGTVLESSEREIDPALLKAGDVVKVLPGTTVSADGEICLYSTSLDEAMITGESMPVDKGVGASVIGGTINVGAGPIFVTVTKIGSDAMLAQIVKLVDDAQTSKAPIQATADRISTIFVPLVIGTALLSFTIWVTAAYTVMPADWLPDGTGRFMFALLFFISTIVIACPCSLGPVMTSPILLNYLCFLLDAAAERATYAGSHHH